MPFHGSDGDSSDGSMHSARKADGEAIVDIESVVPVGTPMAATSIAQFIRCNSHLETMQAKRDVNGWVKWLLIAVFAYLIFAPILAVIPTMKEPAVVGVLWAIIGARRRGTNQSGETNPSERLTIAADLPRDKPERRG